MLSVVIEFALQRVCAPRLKALSDQAAETAAMGGGITCEPGMVLALAPYQKLQAKGHAKFRCQGT